jgi:hypothetical protein
MPLDSKYGRVYTERGMIGDKEPVIIFRAQDRLAPAVIDYYRQLCQANGAGDDHLAAIDRASQAFGTWRSSHLGQVKLPDTPEG